MIRRAAVALFVASILTTGVPDTATAKDLRTCIRINNVTVFAPRGEVYVEVDSSCSTDDFENGDEISVFVEVLVSELPPVSEDFRVSALDPRRRQTFIFDELSLDTGDPVLVRLMQTGEIVGLKSVRVP